MEAISQNKTYLESTNTILRSITLADSKELAEKANDPEIADMMGPLFPFPYTEKDADDYKKMMEEKEKAGDEYAFTIYKKTPNGLEIAGGIGIQIDKQAQKVKNFGYWLNKDYRGQGLVQEAVDIMIDYCFNTLNLRRIEAHTYHVNIASQKVLEGAGFVKEGIERKSAMSRSGEIFDCVFYGLLKEEYVRK